MRQNGTQSAGGGGGGWASQKKWLMKNTYLFIQVFQLHFSTEHFIFTPPHRDPFHCIFKLNQFPNFQLQIFNKASKAKVHSVAGSAGQTLYSPSHRSMETGLGPWYPMPMPVHRQIQCHVHVMLDKARILPRVFGLLIRHSAQKFCLTPEHAEQLPKPC